MGALLTLIFVCHCAGALLVACSHDSIPDELLLHHDDLEPATPATISEQEGVSPEQAQLARKPPQIWERGPQGSSKLSPGHNLSRLSPGHGLSRLSPLRCALSKVYIYIYMLEVCLDYARDLFCLCVSCVALQLELRRG